VSRRLFCCVLSFRNKEECAQRDWKKKSAKGVLDDGQQEPGGRGRGSKREKKPRLDATSKLAEFLVKS